MEKKIIFENIWVGFYMLKHSIRAPGCRLPLVTIISLIFSIIIIRALAHYSCELIYPGKNYSYDYRIKLASFSTLMTTGPGVPVLRCADFPYTGFRFRFLGQKNQFSVSFGWPSCKYPTIYLATGWISKLWPHRNCDNRITATNFSCGCRHG